MRYRLKDPVEMPCPGCGAFGLPHIGPGKAFHLASLRCRHCSRFLKWAGKRDLVPLQVPRQTPPRHPDPDPVPTRAELGRYYLQQRDLQARLDQILEREA